MSNAKKISCLLRWFTLLFLTLVLLVLAPVVVAQPAEVDTGSQTAIYSFPDGKQISVRYRPARTNRKEVLPLGKAWSPGGSPAFLFTEAELRIGNSTIAPGAYSIYLIPGKDEWTLVVSGKVSGGAEYNEKQDILRARMEIGELPDRTDQATIYFGMTGPKGCDMRVDFGKTRAWIEFNEK